MNRKLASLQQRLAPTQACLLSQAGDITYFSQFHFLVPEEREALLLVTAQRAFLLHGRFCPVATIEGVTNIVASYPSQLGEVIGRLHSELAFTTLLLDKSSLFVDEYEAIARIENLTTQELDSQLVWQSRMYKDTQEIASCRQAGRIAAQSFALLQPKIKIGMTEQEVQVILEDIMKKLGSEKPAFPTIVAFGEHTALPHHQPTTQKLANTPVLIDFGATINGYRSDMTRTWWFGTKPDAEFLKIEQIVQDAYQIAFKRVTADKTPTAREIDATARDLITKVGYGDQFIHTTGHGVGLDIHEQPSLNFRNGTLIEPGMVITIEPGIYLEGKFGYRYENTVLVTKKDPQELTI